MPCGSIIGVVGGGPAGMMAAIAAARRGAAVRLWEKNGSLGRKLLATGNGRCNFTNRDLDLAHFHGDRALAAPALAAFGGQQTLRFFLELGIEPSCDERGRYFPASQEAGAVLFALEREMERLGVEVGSRCEVVAVRRGRGGFAVDQRGASHRCAALVLACGGAAAPQHGANGGGFELARQLGHRVTAIAPALVPVEFAGNWHHKLQGVRLDMTLTCSASGAAITDEGLFTHYGLSGPLALRASRSLASGSKAALSFMPGAPRDEVRSKLSERQRLLAARQARDLLTGWLPAKVGAMLVRESGIDPDIAAAELTAQQIEALITNCTAFPVTIKALRGLKEAQVTAGGVAGDGIDPTTMGSTLAPGLFFCGEVVDVDGDSGGYNLQWCWSSGSVAGSSAAGWLDGR
ncbi:MAG TPA: aminoacetone oxidase family FAD-binding enzyme [Candidatus Edwardsbacteria bacterium]|nr:aminoacetone oxidase family FAD-binding enzyme [Candidatus Edwardsbacteria bacterium]